MTRLLVQNSCQCTVKSFIDIFPGKEWLGLLEVTKKSPEELVYNSVVLPTAEIQRRVKEYALP